MISRIAFIALLPFALLACKENTATALPQPAALTTETVSHFCQMTVLDHPGPKAQIHLDAYLQPLFFSQVRDAIAFQRMPEKTAQIKVIYVTDMGLAKNWKDLSNENWITADSAFYVIGSQKQGGMGAPELVPFADKRSAEKFAAQHGGTVIDYEGITDDMVLAPVDIKLPGPAESDAHNLNVKLDEGSG